MPINKTNIIFSDRILLEMGKNLAVQWIWTSLMCTFITLMKTTKQLPLSLERWQEVETIPRPIVHEQLEAKEEGDQKAPDLDRSGDRAKTLYFRPSSQLWSQIFKNINIF